MRLATARGLGPGVVALVLALAVAAQGASGPTAPWRSLAAPRPANAGQCSLRPAQAHHCVPGSATATATPCAGICASCGSCISTPVAPTRTARSPGRCDCAQRAPWRARRARGALVAPQRGEEADRAALRRWTASITSSRTPATSATRQTWVAAVPLACPPPPHSRSHPHPTSPPLKCVEVQVMGLRGDDDSICDFWFPSLKRAMLHAHTQTPPSPPPSPPPRDGMPTSAPPCVCCRHRYGIDAYERRTAAGGLDPAPAARRVAAVLRKGGDRRDQRTAAECVGLPTTAYTRRPRRSRVPAPARPYGPASPPRGAESMGDRSM